MSCNQPSFVEHHVSEHILSIVNSSFELCLTMSVSLKGSKPFAVVLCRFNDVPALSIPKSQWYQFVSTSGRQSLFDYWRDVSYRNIDLVGSEVYGWFTMKYSFIKDGSDQFKDGKTQPRFAWIEEATRFVRRKWD
jgi:hypothetical protein